MSKQNFLILIISITTIIFTLIIFFSLKYYFSNSEINVVYKDESLIKKFQLNTEVSSFKEVSTNTKNISETKNPDAPENFDYEDLLLLQNKQKEVQAKMKLLVINTDLKSTVNETCDYENINEKDDCKRDLFVGCADSLYLGLEMTEECQQFSTKDYLKFIEIKKNQEDEKIKTSGILQTDLGEIHIIENEYNSKSETGLKNSINSGSINTDKQIKNKEELLVERSIIEPLNEEVVSKINWNKKAYSAFYGWVTGWGTLFAVNGGKKEAGQIMNKYTAFGYNPYLKSTCIVSLPYKTIDKFFGTSLDYCVKTKNTNCVIKIKNLIKNRAIEVVMIKNGKRAVFPLGDFGPAEWTGNAIDFTSCARNVLGATGKDLIKFRPL